MGLGYIILLDFGDSGNPLPVDYLDYLAWVWCGTTSRVVVGQ